MSMQRIPQATAPLPHDLATLRAELAVIRLISNGHQRGLDSCRREAKRLRLAVAKAEMAQEEPLR